MKYRKCEICGLKTERKDGQKRFFMARFPLDEARCKQWVKITGKEDLSYIPIEKLHNNKFICGKHFTNTDFKKERTQLKKHAIPSIRLTAPALSDEILAEFPCHIHTGRPQEHKFLKKGVIPSVFLSWSNKSDELSETAMCYSHTVKKGLILDNTKALDSSSSHNEESGPLQENRDRDPSPFDDDSIYVVDDDESLYEHRESPVRTTGAEGGTECHEGYLCNVCGGDIVGFRYACVECSNFDLCGACEARGQHAQHYVLRVPSCKQHPEVQAVLQKIRDELFREEIHSIKIEEEVDLGHDQDHLGHDQDHLGHDQDPLELTAEPLQATTSCQDIKREEGKESLAVKHLGLLKGGERIVFGVQSHQPEIQSHQSKVQSYRSEVQSHQPAVQFHQPEVKSHRPKVKSKVQLQKRPLVREVQVVEKLRVFAGKASAPREPAGGNNAVYSTHRAHHTRKDACSQSEEPLSTGLDWRPSTRKKRKT